MTGAFCGARIEGGNVDSSDETAALLNRIEDRSAVIGVIGLGYVGLPLLLSFLEVGFRVVGVDCDSGKLAALNDGTSYIRHIGGERIAAAGASGRMRLIPEIAGLGDADVIVVCLPTPLGSHREPDLSYIERACNEIAGVLDRPKLVVLESTTYPGTSRQVVVPRLEQSGRTMGRDLFVAFSPEREDPANPVYSTRNIPKIVGGVDAASGRLAEALYGSCIERVVAVGSADTAEAVKLTENIFRCVNIALMNELKVVFEPMGINVWEVVAAAATKPFGFMPFYPGPGIGGHCIPIDPFYLSWRAREFDVTPRFIELSGEVIAEMPRYVLRKLEEALDLELGKGLKGSRILIAGIAYKKNVDDMRESPAFKIMQLIHGRDGVLSYHDPMVPVVLPGRDHEPFVGMSSAAITEAGLAAYDAVVIVTDHDDVDYELIGRCARLVIDTRNAMARVPAPACRVVRA